MAFLQYMYGSPKFKNKIELKCVNNTCTHATNGPINGRKNSGKDIFFSFVFAKRETEMY